jgi:hypothetical protein
MRGQRFMAVAVVALAASASGCGSDDDGPPNAYAEDVIAKADFIQAANAACGARIDQMKEESERVFVRAGKKSPEAGAKLLIEEVVVPGFEGELEDLRALEPPPGDEAEVEGVISAIQEMLDRTRKDLGNDRIYPYRKTENLASAYGLPACGHP